MAAINDLIAQIEDEALRERIEKEVDKLAKQKKFGLVFEEHLPECTPLYDVPVRRGSKVSLREGNTNETFAVLSVKDGKAVCLPKNGNEATEYAVDELVSTAEFGDPIYPCLQPLDSVCNAPDSDLWHTLIEADNYHALQLLEYLYAGKVDCIYIDPPYNSGATDWKYNNRYVDDNDAYRHSKWLSMLQKRLRIAKKLLNPNDSVLIVTIDEREYLHLGCLLEEMFPNANIQMVSSVINPKGAARHQQFGRTDEYLFFVQIGASSPEPLPLTNEWKISEDKRASRLRWKELLRSGSHTAKADSPNQFYPVFVYNTDEGPVFHSVGDSYYGTNTSEITPPEGCVAVWPIRADGTEGNWQISNENLKSSIRIGYAKLGKWRGNKTAITYLAKGEREKISKGAFTIIGHRQDGSIITDDDAYIPKFIPGTQWRIKSHNAEQGGTNLLKKIFNSSRFTFPKSLYAVHDTLRFFVANKPNALIIDFFAGSGTTLHAVNLLNAEDGGKRRCVMVTNNEVSGDESNVLKKQGHNPGDEEWNRLGIARYVTWPRTKCSILGVDVNGKPLSGKYGAEIETYEKIEGEKGQYKKVKLQVYPELDNVKMSDGFKANAAFFKLGFLDKTAVAIGRQLKELIPVLWMKAGAVGECPVIEDGNPDYIILPKNRFALLNEESVFAQFRKELAQYPEIETVYLVTDSAEGYKEMIRHISAKNTYQLYRDYLDNFRINVERR